MIPLLFLFLFISSGAVIYTTVQNIHTVHTLALNSLQSTAFALASSVEQAIRLEGKRYAGKQKMHEIFSDRVIAYALIVQPDGTVSYHTNPALIGSVIRQHSIELLLKNGRPTGERITLLTGTPAYQFDSLLHNADGTVEVLRLVLHTSSADRIVGMTERSWWTVGSVLLFLWITGLLLWRMMARHNRLRADFERRRQMALLGQMTAVLAHEIRNALAGIKGYTQLINETTPDSDPKKADLAAVLYGTGRIERLIQDLLHFSREERYHITSVDASQLLREAADRIEPLWNGRVTIAADTPVQVAADREKIYRVIENGIRNAVQSMDNHSDRTISLSVQTFGRWSVIRIEDTGTGIRPENLSRLFTPFFTTKTDGVGLGLSYSEKVIREMGGQIALANRTDGKGAVLTIHLPKAQETKS